MHISGPSSDPKVEQMLLSHLMAPSQCPVIGYFAPKFTLNKKEAGSRLVTKDDGSQSLVVKPPKMYPRVV
jgi:hypothetical protein